MVYVGFRVSIREKNVEIGIYFIRREMIFVNYVFKIVLRNESVIFMYCCYR